jgi:RNA polymerase sigma-19 factor, ECF subfamily
MSKKVKKFTVIKGGGTGQPHPGQNTSDDQSFDNFTAKDKQNTYVEELYYQHRNSLSRYLKGILPNTEDVNEILHETYIRVLNRDSLDKLDENARAYLFTIATNLVRDQFRKHSVLLDKENIPHEEANLINDDISPERMLEWEKSLALLKKELFKLKPLTRQIFMLHRFEEMTYPEIAKETGVSTRTVERHMHRAIQGLQNCLRDFL